MGRIVIESFTEITSVIVDALVEMEQKVFSSPLSRELILKEISGKIDLVGLIASDKGLFCGYKIGFKQSPEIFYSWIGGVIPEYRRQGIATDLLRKQHEIIKKMGYKYVRTSTKNKYREMLLLNIKLGFDVTGVQKKLKEVEHSIILEKEL